MIGASAPVDGLRIVFANWRDVDHPLAGGAEQYAWELASRLSGAGARVTYLTAQHSGARRRELRDGVQVVRRGSTLSVYPFAFLWLLLHRRHIDVVIDCQNGIPFFAPLAVGKSRPVILVLHHIHQEQFDTRFSPRMASFGRFLEGPISRFVYRQHAIVAVSPSTRHGIRRRLRMKAPVVVVPNGTPVPPPTTVGRADVPTIVCLGRLVPHKRVDLLLHATAQVRERWPDLVVDIVGDGPSRAELEDLSGQLGLTGTVRFHGRVSESGKAELLGAAWLSANPSMGEGWGITVMEAAAAGVPSIAFDVSGLRDSILDGETGWLVPHDQELGDTLCTALDELTIDDFAAEYAERARNWAACFSWEDSTARLAGVVLAELGRSRRWLAGMPQRRQADVACVLEVDDIAPQQAATLRGVLRQTDLLDVQDNCARVLLYGCDERHARLVAQRAGLTGGVRVRVAHHRDYLTVRAHERALRTAAGT